MRFPAVSGKIVFPLSGALAALGPCRHHTADGECGATHHTRSARPLSTVLVSIRRRYPTGRLADGAVEQDQGRCNKPTGARRSGSRSRRIKAKASPTMCVPSAGGQAGRRAGGQEAQDCCAVSASLGPRATRVRPCFTTVDKHPRLGHGQIAQPVPQSLARPVDP